MLRSIEADECARKKDFVKIRYTLKKKRVGAINGLIRVHWRAGRRSGTDFAP